MADYAEVLGLQVRAASDPASLQRMVATAGDRRVVIDTKGAVTGDTDARDVLRELITASGAAPLLAMPGDCAAVEAAAIVAFFAPLGPHALVPTRLDLVHRLGGVLAAADAARLAVPAAGVTPHFAFGLRELTPPMVARRLLAVALENEAARRPGI